MATQQPVWRVYYRTAGGRTDYTALSADEARTAAEAKAVWERNYQDTGQTFVKVQKKEAAGLNENAGNSQVVKIVNGKRTVIERNLSASYASEYARARNKQAKAGTVYRAESMYK